MKISSEHKKVDRKKFNDSFDRIFGARGEKKISKKPHSKDRMKGQCPHGYPQTVRCSRCGE